LAQQCYLATKSCQKQFVTSMHVRQIVQRFCTCRDVSTGFMTLSAASNWKLLWHCICSTPSNNQSQCDTTTACPKFHCSTAGAALKELTGSTEYFHRHRAIDAFVTPHNQAEVQDLPDEICANSLQEHDCLEVCACSTKLSLSVSKMVSWRQLACNTQVATSEIEHLTSAELAEQPESWHQAPTQTNDQHCNTVLRWHMSGIIMHAPELGARCQTCCLGLARGCFLYDKAENRQQVD